MEGQNEGQQECGNGDCVQLINEEGNDQNIFSQRYPAIPCFKRNAGSSL